MEQNSELALAWQFIENTGTHLFLTGKAGTGKTTFLRRLKQESPKRMVVLAPTGIAAINAGGVTIHSFFQIPFAPYVPESSFSTNATYRFRFGKEKINIIRSMDLLVIDEISMVRADLLDAVDEMLRRSPQAVWWRATVDDRRFAAVGSRSEGGGVADTEEVLRYSLFLLQPGFEADGILHYRA